MFLLGTTFCFAGQHEQAIETLRQSELLDPNDVHTLHNIGVSCSALRRHEDAITAYRAVLAKNPDYILSLDNLGIELVIVGQLDEAIASFRRVRELGSTPLVATNLANALSWRMPMGEWPKHYTAALTDETIGAEDRYLLLMQRAIAEWAISDTAALASTLLAAAHLRPKQVNKRLENLMRYETFLIRLLAHRQANPSLYAAAAKTIFLVGDSHSLSYAGICLDIDREGHTVSSHIIIGAKAWHVASARQSQYTVALGDYMRRLPIGAQLICSFGEIDCRLDDGILPYWKKTGGDLEAIVEQQVAQYVSSLAARALPHSLRLLFLSVPAPYRSKGDRRHIITLFNTALARRVREAGHQYIDLHAVTRDADGFSHERLHLDDIHLKPEALAAALSSEHASEPVLERAVWCLSEGRYLDAERLCASVLANTPDNARALYLLGLSLCYIGKRYEEAIAALQRSLSREPSNINALYNLGVSYGEVRRPAEAIEAYQAVLAKDPNHLLALNGIGMELVNTGRLDEAVARFRRVRELSPAHEMSATNLANALAWRMPLTDWPRHYSMALSDESLSADSRYILLVRRAVAEWITCDDAALPSTLLAAACVRPENPNTRTKNDVRYETLLARLLTYRHAHPALYVEAGKPIFLVGDSHSLSYSGTRLVLGGADYKIASHVIIGAKAWHIASGKPNQYAVALDAYLARLPAGAQLICAFGEIDCRLDDGILPYWERRGGELETIVEEQAARYVSALAARVILRRSLKLIFLSIPAPHRTSGDRRHVITLFNTALAKCARAAGHKYIDLHAVTMGDDGFSHERLHLDEFHLKPEALTAALA